MTMTLYTVSHKKEDTTVLPVTSSHIVRFSKLFYVDTK